MNTKNYYIDYYRNESFDSSITTAINKFRIMGKTAEAINKLAESAIGINRNVIHVNDSTIRDQARKSFIEILEQIDQLIDGSSYNNINLLDGSAQGPYDSRFDLNFEINSLFTPAFIFKAHNLNTNVAHAEVGSNTPLPVVFFSRSDHDSYNVGVNGDLALETDMALLAEYMTAVRRVSIDLGSQYATLSFLKESIEDDLRQNFEMLIAEVQIEGGTYRDDFLNGTSSNDALNGGAGSDTLSGGDGNDLIYYDAADTASNITGGAGTDTLYVLSPTGTAPTGFNLTAQGFERALLDQADTTGQSWSQFRYGFDSLWRTDFRDITFDNGSRWVQNFDELGLEVWVELRDVYTTANGYDYQDTYFDTGARWLRNFDDLNNQVWSELRDVYTTTGLYDYQDTYFDIGTRWVRDFDEIGNLTYNEQRDAYTARGLYDYQDIYNKDATRIFRDFDEANAFSWNEHRITYNASGQVVTDLYL